MLVPNSLQLVQLWACYTVHSQQREMLNAASYLDCAITWTVQRHRNEGHYHRAYVTGGVGRMVCVGCVFTHIQHTMFE